MIVIAIGIALAVIVMIITPFFAKESQVLTHGSSINDPEVLRSLKDQLIRRYIEDEAAHSNGNLSAAAWQKRQQFLVNRYVDAARRLDFLEKISTQGQ